MRITCRLENAEVWADLQKYVTILSGSVRSYTAVLFRYMRPETLESRVHPLNHVSVIDHCTRACTEQEGPREFSNSLVCGVGIAIVGSRLNKEPAQTHLGGGVGNAKSHGCTRLQLICICTEHHKTEGAYLRSCSTVLRSRRLRRGEVKHVRNERN